MLDLGVVNVLIGPAAGRRGDRERRSGADAVELFAKLLQKGAEVRFVGVARWKFPIDIDAVENSGLMDAGSEIAMDEHVDTALGEGFAVLRQSGVAEGRGVRASTANRDNDPELGVAPL